MFNEGLRKQISLERLLVKLFKAQFIQVFVAMIVAMIQAEFTFFQMQQKRVFWHARELAQSALGEAPEQLDVVDAGRALHVFVPAVEHAAVAVAHVDQPS